MDSGDFCGLFRGVGTIKKQPKDSEKQNPKNEIIIFESVRFEYAYDEDYQHTNYRSGAIS